MDDELTDLLAQGERAAFHGRPGAGVGPLQRAVELAHRAGRDAEATAAAWLLGVCLGAGGHYGAALTVLAPLSAADSDRPDRQLFSSLASSTVASVHRQLGRHEDARAWDEQARVLRGRDTAEIAAVLSRMHADDVVDAILELPQDRRTAVLDALPAPQRQDVLRLMHYQNRSAGGMMGVEYLAVAPGTTARDAVEAVRDASMQDQALTTVHVVDAENRLIGAVRLIELLRADPQTPVREIAETEPVAVAPSDDVVAVVNTMADFNLLSVPVVAYDGELVGIITVDDALEESIPDDWRERGRTRTP